MELYESRRVWFEIYEYYEERTDGRTHTNTHMHLYMGMAVSLLIAGNFNKRIYGGPR
jgi:hypothetical protein